MDKEEITNDMLRNFGIDFKMDSKGIVTSTIPIPKDFHAIVGGYIDLNSPNLKPNIDMDIDQVIKQEGNHKDFEYKGYKCHIHNEISVRIC